VQSEKLKKYFLFVVAILATVLLAWQDESQDAPNFGGNLRQDEPDSFIVNGKQTLFDEQGNVSSIIKSEKTQHYPDKNMALLTEPNLLIYRDDGTQWRITADSGEYDLNEESIELEKNVVIIRDEQLATHWKLTTESLTILNKSRYITTKQAVTISNSVSVMNAVGMKAWLDNKKIELTSNVRGSYVQLN